MKRVMMEEEAYKKFLNSSYKNAEKENGKRAESRTRRGCLTKDWEPDDLSGKSILVVGENGIGDEVLTIGLLGDLAPECGSVTWECDPKLKVLFTRSFPEASFISYDDPQTNLEGVIYSWELIGRFRKELNNFPERKSYLRPLEALKDTLSARYGDGSKKVVGLAWRSERNGRTQHDKTCCLRDVSHWGAFFNQLRDKTRFVSLQYGDTGDEIAFARWKYGVDIYQDESIDIFDDVDAAAAQIAAMDYVVSIGTTAAHLAGALGVQGRVLLQAKPFGHWRAGETKCPWYPTLRLVKQSAAGDWKTVLESVTKSLIAGISKLSESPGEG